MVFLRTAHGVFSSAVYCGKKGVRFPVGAKSEKPFVVEWKPTCRAHQNPTIHSLLGAARPSDIWPRRVGPIIFTDRVQD